MIDPIRHVSQFNPDTFAGRIDIIGVGATGSRVAVGLAKLGVEHNLHLWDFDRVESHNVPNQLYGVGHVGQSKVAACQAIIRDLTGTVAVAHEERVDGSQELGDVVFLLTDTMASRREIWERAIRFRFRTKLVIETRMGVETGQVFTVNPNDPEEVRAWEATLCSDEQAEDSACGGRVTVGPTADVLAGYALWQFIRWHRAAVGQSDEPTLNELMFSLRPPLVMNRRFAA